MKTYFLTVLWAVLLLSVTASIFRIDVVRPSQIWTVDDDAPADFNTIQSAIDSSLVVEGDTVYVRSGMYREHVFLNKSISLVGQNPLTTIIDGNASEYFPPLEIFNTINAVVRNFTVQNTTASSESYGILIYKSRNFTLQNVIAADSYYGVLINNSTQCRILDNAIRDNHNSGIVFRGNSGQNTIAGNLISDNPTGIYVEAYSEHNVFYRNNIVSNTLQYSLFPPTYTSWDNGVEGNYWSDYEGVDTNGDGVGDTDLQFLVDKHPLIELWNQTRTYNVSSHQVVVSCNYTVASFAFNDTLNQIVFYITGPAGWSGFCNVAIPKELLNPKPPSEEWMVILGDSTIAYLNESVDSYTLIRFTYSIGATMKDNRVRIRTGTLYPPTASFQFAPDPASTIELVNFTDTSTESPSDGKIVWRQWNFGDGNVVDNETFVSHQFSSKAFFNVTLTVRDNNSLTDSVTRLVWVRNLSPSADFSSSPANPSVGFGVSFDASGSTDSDGGIAGYRWNFGDGTVENMANPMVTHRFVHVGTYNVTLTVVDGDGGENVTAQNISVGKGPTHIDIIAPTSVRVEEPLTINAILLDEDGLPITGKQIEVEVFDGDLDISRNINTGALGMAATTLSLNATGQHAIRVSYAGSIDYLSSESTLTLSVNLMATSLELQAPENATQNSDVILSATLMGDDGNSIYNATVEFHVHNGNAWELLGISQTDQNGTARFGYTPTHTGTFKSRASYNGDWKHAASTSGEHSFTVVASGMDYVPYVLLGAMVASVAIVLLIVFTRRRGKSNQSER